MRVEGWPEILDGKIVAARSREFAWGDFDCCRFAAECVDAITGGDYLARLSEKYSDRATAFAYIEASGGVRVAVSTFLGDPVEKWALARRGDVCLIPTVDGEGLGICVGAMIAGVDQTGVGLYSLDKALAVWLVD